MCNKEVHLLVIRTLSVVKMHGATIKIKMNLTEIESEGVDWINLANDRDQWVAVVNTIIKIQLVPYQSAAFLTS